MDTFTVRLLALERVTFEYVLLGGVTDRPEHAAEVARLVRRTRPAAAKVNLIAADQGPESHTQCRILQAVERFRATLVAAGIPAFVRRPRGRDIVHACGQPGSVTVEG